MKPNKKAIQSYASQEIALPEGYTIEVQGFQKVALLFNGELLKVCGSKVYAANAASRHSMGQPV